MRILAVVLVLACLAGPVLAETPRGVQDALSSYATRLLALNRQRQLLTRMRALVTPEQEDVLRHIHLTPDQSMKLLGLLQEQLPSMVTGGESTEVLQQRLAPRVIEIIGPEQADLILQLTPTPQQRVQMQALLEESNALWRNAMPTSADVQPLLEADWMSLFNSMFRTR